MAGEELKYKFGLRNSAGKYLTMESFGNKVNASGSSLKSKQVWTLEQDNNFVFLKSHKGEYCSERLRKARWFSYNFFFFIPDDVS